MNTVAKGDHFENRSYELIQNSIKSGQLGLIASQCKVFRKKGYYSNKRKKDIVFDLTIEVWPPGAERFIILYIIECKALSKKVPVDDVEEFQAKVDQVAELNGKAIFITNNGFQQGAFNYAESTGMMLIQLNYDETHQVLLHKIHRAERRIATVESEWDDTIRSILKQTFDSNSRITGLKKLSRETIENITLEILRDFNSNLINYSEAIPFDTFIPYITSKYKLSVELNESLGGNHVGNEILGYLNKKEMRIYVDKSIQNSNRFPFIFCHELGHFFLHEELQLNQEEYNTQPDSRYNFYTDRHELKNDKHWIEWQANQFAVSMILPSKSISIRLIEYQRREGISHRGRIYVDHQPINQIDYNNTMTFLSSYFGVTKKNVIYRLQQLEILQYADTVEHISRSGGYNWFGRY